MALCMRDIDARKALPKVIFRRLKRYRGQHFCFHGLRSGNPGQHRGSEGRYRRFRPDAGGCRGVEIRRGPSIRGGRVVADRNRHVARLEHEEYHSTAGTRCSRSLRAGDALWSRSWPILVRLHDTAARSRFPKCRHISCGHRRADWCIRPRSHGGDRCSGDFREPRSALARLERAIIGHKDRSYCLRRARHPGRNYRGLVLRVASAGKLSGCRWNPPLRL